METKFYKLACVMFEDMNAVNSVLSRLVTKNNRPYIKSLLIVVTSVVLTYALSPVM